MEKLILALVTTARKLCPYFQAHTIEILTKYLMKQVLHKPETSGRLMKWAIELSEFDIRYKLKTTIKGQILADFVMEFTSTKLIEATQATSDLPNWRLSVDGAANAQGSGAGLILTSPEGIDIEYALRFGFRAFNNEVEYEAVIAGLNLAHSMEVDQLEVCNDSQLVVKQIEDSYEARGEKMILYLKKVRELLKKFVRVQIRHIPRVENSREDALAKLATASQEDLNRLTSVGHLSEPSVDLNSKEIRNYYSSLAHPQSNGQAEVTIRTLKAALKTKLEGLKGKWGEYLLEVLWPYRTTRKSATQETPFALAFGTEAVAPVEIGLKSPRIELESVEHNKEALRLNLDLLDEKCDQVLKSTEDYQRKTTRYYEKKGQTQEL